MNRTALLVGLLVVLGITAAIAFAQPDMQGGQGGQGGPGMMPGGGPSSSAAIAVTDRFVFIVRGSQVFKLDVESLDIVAQKDLPEPARKGGRQQQQQQQNGY
jgi:hypothetical protein